MWAQISNWLYQNAMAIFISAESKSVPIYISVT